MRRWLIGVALATTAMVAIAFFVPMAFLVRDFARQSALRNADRDAQVLGPVLAASTDTAVIEQTITVTRSGAAGRITVYGPDGRTWGAAPRADEARYLDRALAGEAFSKEVSDGVLLFTPIARTNEIAVVRVFVPSSELDRGVTKALVAIAALALVLVAVAVAVADRLAMSISKPVASLAAAARQLGQGDLSTRVDPAGPPEVAEVGNAFNTLAGRVTELLAAERELVADLSHRLRTPLTALRLDAEALGRGPAADRVRDDVDEVEQTVTRLIHEARRPLREPTAPVADIAAIVRDRMDFWAPLAEEQQRQWFWTGTERAAKVRLSAPDLEAAIDALLGNTFDHTPEGTSVRVWLQPGDGAITLVIDDDGPGFVLHGDVERGRSSGGSTGLGLDIARRTAESANGSLRVSTRPAGGGRVEMKLPLL